MYTVAIIQNDAFKMTTIATTDPDMREMRKAILRWRHMKGSPGNTTLCSLQFVQGFQMF